MKMDTWDRDSQVQLFPFEIKTKQHLTIPPKKRHERWWESLSLNVCMEQTLTEYKLIKWAIRKKDMLLTQGQDSKSKFRCLTLQICTFLPRLEEHTSHHQRNAIILYYELSSIHFSLIKVIERKSVYGKSQFYTPRLYSVARKKFKLATVLWLAVFKNKSNRQQILSRCTNPNLTKCLSLIWQKCHWFLKMTHHRNISKLAK